MYGYHLNVSSAITMQYMNMIIINVHGRVKLGDTVVSNAFHILSLSGDTALTFMPGNFSKHVLHLETSRAANENGNCTNRLLLSLSPVTLSCHILLLFLQESHGSVSSVAQGSLARDRPLSDPEPHGSVSSLV